MAPKVVQPMEPEWLIQYFSKATVNEKLIKCIIAAFDKYHKAIEDAGEDLEKDLLKCKDPSENI